MCKKSFAKSYNPTILQSYDPDTHWCVRKVLLILTIQQSYDPDTHRCVRKVLLILTILQSYDPDTRRCVRKVSPIFTILQSYDPDTRRCVRYVLQILTRFRSYDPGTRRCDNNLGILGTARVLQCSQDRGGYLGNFLSAGDLSTYTRGCSQVWCALEEA